jgi:hypothetical protein
LGDSHNCDSSCHSTHISPIWLIPRLYRLIPHGTIIGAMILRGGVMSGLLHGAFYILSGESYHPLLHEPVSRDRDGMYSYHASVSRDRDDVCDMCDILYSVTTLGHGVLRLVLLGFPLPRYVVTYLLYIVAIYLGFPLPRYPLQASSLFLWLCGFVCLASP